MVPGVQQDNECVRGPHDEKQSPNGDSGSDNAKFVDTDFLFPRAARIGHTLPQIPVRFYGKQKDFQISQSRNNPR